MSNINLFTMQITH